MSIEQAAALAAGFGAMSLTVSQPSLRPGSSAFRAFMSPSAGSQRPWGRAAVPYQEAHAQPIWMQPLNLPNMVCPPGTSLYLRIGQHDQAGPFANMAAAAAYLQANLSVKASVISLLAHGVNPFVCRPNEVTGIQVGRIGMHGIGDDMDSLTQAAGLGAIFNGLGIPGPYGAVPDQAVPSGTYEITGTQVALRGTPNGAEIGRFNNKYGANGNLVVEPADQVDFDSQVGNAGGLSWGHVTVKSGELAGKTGYVAMEYMAPVGWTKQHGGTGPAQGGGNITPASDTTDTTTTTDYTPYILGGAAVVGAGIIIWALASPKHGKGKHRRRHRHA